MYEAYFHLKRRPFAATPDPQCFLASGTIQAALDEVVVCIEQGQGIAVVTAPAGTGKTLLCERLRSELGERFESVFLRHASFLTRRALLQTILCELNHSYRQQDEQELRLELMPAIRALRPQREALVLICDEAHQLTEDLLEELRILSDLAENGRPLVRFVLVGQLGLEETLALSSLEALSQRIRAQVCLEALNHVGSLDYIDYRLTWAGGRTEEVFDPQALELISRAADGVPRCINQLCDHALLLAYVAEQQPVSVELVREALQDLRQLPLHWNEAPLRDPSSREAVTFETSLETVEARLDNKLTPCTGSSATESVEMESIEFGADLPSPALSTTEAFAETNALANDVASEPDRHSLANDNISNPSADGLDVHEADEAVAMLESPSIWNSEALSSTFVPIAPEPVTILRSRSPGGFTEELVLDRYAAIDAGLTPPELPSPDTMPAPEVHTNASCEPHTAWQSQSMPAVGADAEANFLAETGRDSATPDWNEAAVTDQSIQTNVSDAAQHDAATCGSMEGADFREVCERLDTLLPQVAEAVSWDSETVHAELTPGFAPACPSTEGQWSGEQSTANETVSMEERLGNEVCQLAEQLQKALDLPPREHSPVEQLQGLLTSAYGTPVLETQTETMPVEFAVIATTEHAANLEALATDVVAPPNVSSRPYRNLFSQLRRKQQGLL